MLYKDNSTPEEFTVGKNHKADKRKEMIPVFQLTTGNNRSFWFTSLVNLVLFLNLLFPDPFWLSIPDDTCFPALQCSATRFVHHVGYRTYVNVENQALQFVKGQTLILSLGLNENFNSSGS